MIDKIINKNNLKILISISFLICSLTELLFFNFSTLKYRDKYNAEILEIEGFKKEGKWYISESDNSYITVKIKENYINKLEFDYKSNEDFSWKINYLDSNVSELSSALIDRAIRKINLHTDTIKIEVHDKNIKIKDITVNNSIYFNFLRFLTMFLTLIFILILYTYRDYFSKYKETAYLVISLSTGILMILAFPKSLYLSWDDSTHFINANKFISSQNMEYSKTFDILKKQDYIKSEIFQTVEEKIRLYKALDNLHLKTKYIRQINDYSSKYNKLIYFPFYLSFKICSVLGISFMLSFVMAKILNLLLYSLIFYFAIKVNTKYKNYIYLIGLSVSCMFLATQFSYDPTIIASIVLAFSLYTRMLEDKTINSLYLFIFVIATVWASLPKAIYAPVLLLVVFLPNSKFKNKKYALIIKTIIIFITLLLMSTFILPMLIGGVAGDARGGNTNASEQFHLIISNPLRYAKLLLKFFIVSGPELFIGTQSLTKLSYASGYADSIINFVSVAFYILLFYVVFSNKIEVKYLSNKIKILYGILYFVIFSLISTALYLSFTEVGSYDIAGVQARYFLPLLPFLLSILTPTVKNGEKEKYKINEVLLLIIPFILLMMIIFLIIIKQSI